MLTQSQKKKIIDLIQMSIPKQDIAQMVGVGNHAVSNLLSTKRRVLVISDPHCGHRSGLTPPKWQQEFSPFYDQQVEMWVWYKNIVRLLKPDTLFVLGDMVDGKGKRSGGSEQVTMSFREQLKMAECCISEVGANAVIAVNGTPYHVGFDEDFESFLKDIKIGGHEFPRIHNIQFDLKHKIGSSSIPHGRYTALAKSRLWNQLWKDIGGQPKADVIIRGHTHYFDFCGSDEYLAVICPALQGWGSKYGVRQCEGIVNTGLLWFDIYDGTDLQNLQWWWDLPKLDSQKVEVYQT